MKLRTLLLLLTAALLWAPAARADALNDIQARKTLRIGVAEFAPWTFTNKAGALEGLDIDLGRQLAGDLGATPEFKVYALDDLFAAAERGEIDLIAAGLAITPARALKAEFSLPYFESGTTLVVTRPLHAEVKQPADLNRAGVTVLAVADTFSAGIAAQLYDVATLRLVPDRATAERELLAGRAQALLTNLPDARILARQHGESLALPLSQPIVRSVAGFAVKRGNQALLNFLNAWVTSRLADNLIPSLTNYWFNGDEWTDRIKPSAQP